MTVTITTTDRHGVYRRQVNVPEALIHARHRPRPLNGVHPVDVLHQQLQARRLWRLARQKGAKINLTATRSRPTIEYRP